MARQAPTTIPRLAAVKLEVRSDYAAWCMGVDKICEQLALIILAVEDELYVRLSAGKRDYAARSRARRATRPLRVLATMIRTAGRMANRAYRVYQRHYAEEINPQRRTQAFDHRK